MHGKKFLKLCIFFVLSVLSTLIACSDQKQKLGKSDAAAYLAIANTYVVTSVDDSGDNTHVTAGSLRWALVSANASPGFDLITFNIPGIGVKTITIKNYFPEITDNAGLMIDGTQSNGRIEIDGSNVHSHHGILIGSNNNTIKGLTINGIQDGGTAIAIINGASNNYILGNYIGVTPDGMSAKGNSSGIYIAPGGYDNWIGGTNGVSPGGRCTGDCNVISGNQAEGIVISHSSNNHVIGNFIGVNVTGDGPLPNGDDGVLLGDASSNIIGGPSAEERNIISSNVTINVELGDNCQNNLVQGNYIGVNSAGTRAFFNPGAGIELDNNAHDNTIDGNVISGHEKFGILSFMGSSRTVIKNNQQTKMAMPPLQPKYPIIFKMAS